MKFVSCSRNDREGSLQDILSPIQTSATSATLPVGPGEARHGGVGLAPTPNDRRRKRRRSQIAGGLEVHDVFELDGLVHV